MFYREFFVCYLLLKSKKNGEKNGISVKKNQGKWHFSPLAPSAQARYSPLSPWPISFLPSASFSLQSPSRMKSLKHHSSAMLSQAFTCPLSSTYIMLPMPLPSSMSFASSQALPSAIYFSQMLPSASPMWASLTSKAQQQQAYMLQPISSQARAQHQSTPGPKCPICHSCQLPPKGQKLHFYSQYFSPKYQFTLPYFSYLNKHS